MYNNEDYVDDEREKKSRSINDIFFSGIRKLCRLRDNIENKEYNVSYIITNNEFDVVFTRLNKAVMDSKPNDLIKDDIFWLKLHNAMRNCNKKITKKTRYIIGYNNNIIQCL